MPEMIEKNTVEMGWAARPMKEQFPVLDDDTAWHLYEDSRSMSRLRIRGIITDAEAKKARDRFVKKVAEALKKASK